MMRLGREIIVRYLNDGAPVITVTDRTPDELLGVIVRDMAEHPQDWSDRP